ncbi:MAG: cytochrome c oxidase subunit II [Rhodothermales bacterium]
MKVVVYEKAFLAVGGVLLIACLLALVFASVSMGISLPGREGRIDPAALDTTPPFDEPGVREVAPGRYEAVVIGFAFGFTPSTIRIPAGSELTIIATARDVIHGFNIEATRVNMMLIPGQISRYTYRFDEPREYLLICHEFCGVGHHAMFGRIIVE